MTLADTRSGNVQRIKKMSPKKRQKLIELATPRIVEPYTKHIPHPAQQVFLSLNNKREVMYGGAAGGGKSDALLMAALQYVDVPGYSALLLRRTWPDLNLPGAIMDRTRTWLSNTPAHPREGGRRWEFPSGAVLTFGYLQHDKDKFRYQSAEFQFIGFDELTQFESSMYSYLFSRLRRPAVPCLNCPVALRKEGHVFRHVGSRSNEVEEGIGAKACTSPFPDPKVLEQYTDSPTGMSVFNVPLRMRSATNPGGIGHEWVRQRFIDDRTKEPGAIFVPARLTDNPAIDQDSYVESLEHLDIVDRQRLLDGDWDVAEEGDMFQRHFFNAEEEPPKNVVNRIRFWDMAATKGGGDWTVGCLMSLDANGMWHIEDIVRGQWGPLETERVLLQTAMHDGRDISIRMEQEPGSSGVTVIDHYRRNVFVGFDFDGVRSTGAKEVRAKPLSSAVQAGNVFIVLAAWNRDYLDEMALFPNGNHDDQVDATTGAMTELAFGGGGRLLV